MPEADGIIDLRRYVDERADSIDDRMDRCFGLYDRWFSNVDHRLHVLESHRAPAHREAQEIDAKFYDLAQVVRQIAEGLRVPYVEGSAITSGLMVLRRVREFAEDFNKNRERLLQEHAEHAEAMGLRSDRDRLLAENARLRVEPTELREENARLKKELDELMGTEFFKTGERLRRGAAKVLEEDLGPLLLGEQARFWLSLILNDAERRLEGTAIAAAVKGLRKWRKDIDDWCASHLNPTSTEE